MNAYVIVAAKRRRRIPRHVVDRIESGGPHLHFDASNEIIWSNPSGTVIVRSWEVPNPGLGIATHWSCANGGFTTFVGHAWPRSPWRRRVGDWADQLADLCTEGSPDALVEALAGCYSFLTLNRDGAGWIMTDPLGLSMVYAGETRDFTAYSSRENIAAWAITNDGEAPARDTMGVAWLAYSGYLIGSRTGYSHVRTVEQGVSVEIDPCEGTRERETSAVPWQFPGDTPSDDELVEDMRRDIADYLHLVADLPATEKIVGLTGGKDSRLILSILVAEQLTDSMTFFTRGNESLPDVVYARELADAFHLHHRWGIIDSGPRTPLTDRYRSFVANTSGMRSVWDYANPVVTEDVVNVNGLCGEVLRTNYPGMSGLESKGALARRFRQGWRFGSAGLLHADAENELRRDALESLFDDPIGDLTPLDLVDRWFVRNRLRRWGGTEQEVDRSNRLFPLYSVAAVRAAYAIGAVRRHGEFLHRRLMQTTCPRLFEWKLLGPGWRWTRDSPATGSRLRNGDPVQRLSGAGAHHDSHEPAHPTTANERHQDRILRETKRAFVDLFLGDANNPVFDVVDPQRAIDTVRDIEHLDPKGRIQLYGALTAAIWLGAS